MSRSRERGQGVQFEQSIIQIKHIQFTNQVEQYDSQGNTRLPVTNFYIDFTPKESTSNNIIICTLSVGYYSTPSWSWYIDYDISSTVGSFTSSGVQTQLGVLAQNGNRMNGYHGGSGVNFTDYCGSYTNTLMHDHNTNTTYPIRYQVCTQDRYSQSSDKVFINRTANDSNSGNITRGSSSMLIMEMRT